MRLKTLRDELEICHATMRALTKINEEQKKDIAILNESLNIVTEERDYWKKKAEGANK